jgi:hypothetical protein
MGLMLCFSCCRAKEQSFPISYTTGRLSDLLLLKVSISRNISKIMADPAALDDSSVIPLPRAHQPLRGSFAPSHTDLQRRDSTETYNSIKNLGITNKVVNNGPKHDSPGLNRRVLAINTASSSTEMAPKLLPTPSSTRGAAAGRRIRESRIDRWNSNLSQLPLLSTLENLTGVRKIYIAALFLGLIFLFFTRGIGLNLLSAIIGFAYPLHMTLKTIKQTATRGITAEQRSKERMVQEQRELDENCLDEMQIELIHRARLSGGVNQKLLTSEDRILALRQWIVYWIIYGLFSFWESLSDNLLNWLPLYYPLKLFFLLWCFLPQYQGSNTLYYYLLRPLIHRHSETIENSAEIINLAAQEKLAQAFRQIRAQSVDMGSLAGNFSSIFPFNLASLSRNNTPSHKNEKKEAPIGGLTENSAATVVVKRRDESVVANATSSPSQQTGANQAKQHSGENDENQQNTGILNEESEMQWSNNPIVDLSSEEKENSAPDPPNFI